MLVAFTLVAGLLSSAARAEEMADLELVLAVDISRSMDREEQIIQRDGYVQAFRSPDVINAILGGGLGRISVTYMEWASETATQVVVPWTLIDSRESAFAFADQLAQRMPSRLSRTSISGAILASGTLFGKGAWRGVRRVIDVSGDGPNNNGGPVEAARDMLVSQGIVINGLPLLVREDPYGMSIRNLDDYYYDCVIGGTGSFMIAVRDWEGFAEAVRRKLVLEIAGREPMLIPAAMPVAAAADRPKVDCMIGEKLWMQRMRDWEIR